MDFRVFSQNLPEKMQARCVRKDAEQALMDNLSTFGQDNDILYLEVNYGTL